MTQENLAQMGAARVRKCERDGQPLIEKRGASRVEIAFYCHSAGALRERGIHTPALLGVEAQTATLWLEWLPHTVSLEALCDDEALYRTLGALHAATPAPGAPLHPHYWRVENQTLLCEVLSLAPDAVAILQEIAARSDSLFTARTLISGDTNAGNWGRRDNGDLVLFDWERIGYGNPAIDLAPLIKGMGSLVAYNAMIDRYTPWAAHEKTDDLLQPLIIAKAWIATEVVSLLHQRQNPQRERYVDWYRQVLPGWLREMASVL
ncbi:phosphotransferase [Cronobacter muytjensii]|uniref:phosphotransferase n=1 Tax=Cronobacter muytjensii TaxID=413501 RepID=UPI000283F1F2|nr:phosphotransferase [Cronobacter muytjensii]MDI6453872.1 phosphotransferase [Cronobacter muytjensii]